LKLFSGSLAWLLAALGTLIAAPGCEKPSSPERPGQVTLRVGHFPNITHAQGVIAHALSRQKKGWFEERLGPDVKIEWFVYNAGPSAMEALFAKSLDLTYVGPSPALNAYSKSDGAEIRIISGAAHGGAALVVHDNGDIKAPTDFRGKKVATPQLGNTQDVACRSWLIEQGLKVTQIDGDVTILPTANPDQLTLFQKKDVDAVWTVEPWVSRLELDAAGKVFLEEKSALTTVLVSSAALLKEKNDVARKFAKAHRELTEWINKNPAEAQRLLREELKAETTREVSQALIEQAWKRLEFTNELSAAPFEKLVKAAQQVGFLKELTDLSKLIEVLQ
jgi:NitT/TauT family transport system substrate-binding protein